MLFVGSSSTLLSAAQSLAAVGAATEKVREDKWLLPPLSEQLQLDELWDILSECLTQLSRTPDHHAVLVLQPTVEAFFLVHAGGLSRMEMSGREGAVLIVYDDVGVDNLS